jgi:menaquinone-dependent protoporphyrinogen oxidase
MSRMQVVYASRHGGTAGIAERIAAMLRSSGIEVDVADAARNPDPAGFDGYVVGSGVYMGSWLKEGTDWLERNSATLSARPVWLVSSGPLPGSSKETADVDPIANALGPADGPGSGGRKRVEALAAVIHPRDHVVFEGAYDPSEKPKSMAERVVRIMPASKNVRPWGAIDSWSRSVAEAVRNP